MIRSERVKQIVIGELEDLANRIAANIEATGQKNTGGTADSLKVIESESNVFDLVGRPGIYGLETGLHHRPPFAAIYNWIITKGLQKENEAKTRGFAYAIQNKMASDGSFLYRNKRTFGGVQNPDVYSSEIKKTVENLYDKLGVFIIREIESITLNY